MRPLQRIAAARRRLSAGLRPIRAETVRANVVKRPDCGTDVLRRLAGDRSERVRAGVAEHADCGTDALRRLAGDDAVEVRAAAAANAACPARSA